MRPAQTSSDELTSDTRTGAPQKRLRDRWALVVPTLVIVIALYHLVACWNSPQPTPLGSGPHRTIYVVQARHQVPTTASASWSEPSLVRDDEPESATLPAAGASWPFGAGWR
jgi:hypothetical protein